MKAKEYFEKYNALFIEEANKHPESYPDSGSNWNRICIECAREFAKDAQDLLKARKPKNPVATYAVMNEVNNKWNAMVDLFEKKYHGHSPFRRNGFTKLFEFVANNDRKPTSNDIAEQNGFGIPKEENNG